MFKLLFFLSFFTLVVKANHKPLGFTRSGVKCANLKDLHFPRLPRGLMGSENLRILGKREFDQNSCLLEMISRDKEICRQELDFHGI